MTFKTGQTVQIKSTDQVGVIRKVKNDTLLVEYIKNNKLTGEVEEISSGAVKSKKVKHNDSLEHRVKLYKEGKADVPVLRKKATVKVNETGKKVILSLEEPDRDDEIVKISGVEFGDAAQGVPMLDSHQMYGSVVENTLGSFRNLRKETINEREALVGDPDFAPTPRGQIAEVLYMGVDGGRPYLQDVSIGFAVLEYDNETKVIERSELFEASLVIVGANFGAEFVDAKDASKGGKELKKKLAHYKEIHPAFKEFTGTFLSNQFCKEIGYEKTGDLLVDINNIYDSIVKQLGRKQETPESPEEPSETVSTKDMEEFMDHIQKSFENNLISKITQNE